MKLFLIGSYTFFILQVILALMVSYWVHRLSFKLLPFSLFRIIVGPGIILHELSHAFGCLITGAKIQSIEIFNRDGGKVTHAPPKLKIFGPFIISMAPLIIGIIGWLLFTNYYPSEVRYSWFLSSYVHKVGQGSTNLFSWRSLAGVNFWIYMLVVYNLAIAIVPSKQDLKNCWPFLIIIILSMFLIDNFMSNLFPHIKFQNSILLLNTYCFAVFAILLLLYGFYEIFKK